MILSYDILKMHGESDLGGDRMRSHGRKMIAPIVVSLVVVLYYIVYFAFLISFLDLVWGLILGIIPLVLAILMIWVCVDRINEIKKGEEDDLSKY